ncbi:MAG: acetyl-CoA carboxylase biotin carboxyl carrier protein subunit [Bacteroidales bacterium]
MDIVAEPTKGQNNNPSTPTNTSANATINTNDVASPMPGKILSLKVKQGDKVCKGQTIAVLEAMKMENDIASDYNGTVNCIFVKEGDSISENTKIIDLIPE